LSIFLELVKKDSPKDRFRLLSAVIKFARPEFTDYSMKVFDDPSAGTQMKIYAAWNLANMGSVKHFDYLVTMLDDPEIRTANLIDPGCSLRAAQAISRIKGWDFEWEGSSVALVKAKLNS
jgi:hypothetical protein